MKLLSLWKLALALVLVLSLALVSAQDEPNDGTPEPDTDQPPIMGEAEEGAPEFAGGFEFAIPNIFATGDTLSAAEMNANFTQVGNGIDSKLNYNGTNSSYNNNFYNYANWMYQYLNGGKLMYLDRDNSSTNASFQVRAGTSSAIKLKVDELGDVTVGRDLYVNDDATITDNLYVNGDIYPKEQIYMDNPSAYLYLRGTNPYLQINPGNNYNNNNANAVRLRIYGRVATSTLQITGGSDLAEPFNIAASPTVTPIPGMVVAIDPNNAGELMIATEAYDTKVAGIISGAGGVQPGMIMSQNGAGLDGPGSLPVALSGRVHVWVDASYGAIQAGDLLTTSATHGHAMLVSDHGNAHGSIIGKAMTSLDEGTGLVLVLISMQ